MSTVKQDEAWSIRMTGQCRPSDGAALVSVEFDEHYFTHMAREDRQAAAFALLKAASMLMESNLNGDELPVIVVPYQPQQEGE